MVAFDDYMNDCLVNEAHRRKFIAFSGTYIQYNLGGTKRSFALSDPEELVRARAVSYLILKKSYSPQRIRVEVKVPRRTPSDWADIVVYSDDDLKAPYLVVETKAPGKSDADISQAIEQLFGNANSLRSPYGLLDYANGSIFFDVMDYPAEEREKRIGEVAGRVFQSSTDKFLRSVLLLDKPLILELLALKNLRAK